MLLRALCSGQLSTEGQLQRKLPRAGEEETDISMGPQPWIYHYMFWWDSWKPTPFKLFWKLNLGFKCHLREVPCLDLLWNVGIDKNSWKFWGRLCCPRGSSCLLVVHSHAFALVGSSDRIPAFLIFREVLAIPNGPRLGDGVQDRRVRGRLLMMV